MYKNSFSLENYSCLISFKCNKKFIPIFGNQHWTVALRCSNNKIILWEKNNIVSVQVNCSQRLIVLYLWKQKQCLLHFECFYYKWRNYLFIQQAIIIQKCQLFSILEINWREISCNKSKFLQFSNCSLRISSEERKYHALWKVHVMKYLGQLKQFFFQNEMQIILSALWLTKTTILMKWYI